VKFVGEQITQGEGEADEDMAKCMKKKRFFDSLSFETIVTMLNVFSFNHFDMNFIILYF